MAGKLLFDRLVSAEMNAGAYTSNLTPLKGEVYGSKSLDDPDLFASFVKWSYEYERETGTLYIWKNDEPETKYKVFENVLHITELSFTFSRNMQFFAVYNKKHESFIYNYNPISTTYLELQIEDLVTPRAALTSLHPANKAEAQIVIAYINKNYELCVRKEEDRFYKEYVIKKFPKKAKLVNIGYNDIHRFQYEVLEAV